KKSAERLAAVLAETSFTPSAAAKSLSAGTSFKLVGLVCYNIDDMYYAKAVSVLEKELKQNGYEMILSCTGKSVREKEAAIEGLIGKSVDALLFIGSVFMDGSGRLIRGAARRVPCFIINALIEGENIYSAYCDDRAAVRAAAEALLAAGCKKPIFLYDVETYGSDKKRRGFLDAVKTGEAFRLPEDFLAAKAAAIDLYRACRPDAAICANDVLAAAALHAAKALGIAVPRDLKIVGHNDSLLARCTSPALTSIDNGVERLALLTAERLVRHFNGERIASAVKIEYTLQRRESF
ncbi:MAG: LacI family transcriptional regulator, partial [Clostridiales bacterium]|nr:LacI family transcriptional regulator [Clostridiales bacterium]